MPPDDRVDLKFDDGSTLTIRMGYSPMGGHFDTDRYFTVDLKPAPRKPAPQCRAEFRSEAKEHGGFRCELPPDHTGDHACPKALDRFMARRADDAANKQIDRILEGFRKKDRR